MDVLGIIMALRISIYCGDYHMISNDCSQYLFIIELTYNPVNSAKGIAVMSI